MDHVSISRRAEIMRAVRSKHTAPEVCVRKAAHRLGLRFRLHAKYLPGTPDLVLPKWKTVIFVNGCFWHRHVDCKKTTTPITNVPFWEEKFSRNVERDANNYRKLTELGWRVVVIWQCTVPTLEKAEAVLLQYFANE